MAETRSKKGIIAVIFTGVLMGALDISIVGPAIPSIEKTINIEPRLLGWIFSIYVLFNLTGISLFARLSDKYGRRNIYILSTSVFAAGSLIVSMAPDFQWIIIGRAVQGFGASGIFPVASAVVGDLFPAEKRGRILGLLGAVFGFAFIIGPIMAGTLLHWFEWHVLFLVNIPIVLVLIFASIRILPNTKVQTNGPFDWKGILSLGLMLGSFAYGINSIDSESFVQSLLSKKVLPFLLASVILFVTTVLIEKRAYSPVLKPDLFFRKQIRIVGIIAVATGILQASFVFVPNYAVGLFGVSASAASFMLVPLVIATAIGSPVFGRMIDSAGSKKVIMIGLILAITGFYLLHTVMISKVLFYASGALIGFGLSVLAGSSLRYIMLNEAGKNDRAVTQGMLTIFISLGQLTGSAIIGVIIAKADGVSGYKHAFLYESVLLFAVLGLSFMLKNREVEKSSIISE
jgi:MFS family permease